MAIFDGKPRAKANANLPPREVPWVEKYRPKRLDEVSSQDHAVAVLTKTLQSSNLSHMLFYGPPGTGKTSTILALCKELFGPELMKTRVLELNASDERGISIVREKIKNFARVTVSSSVKYTPYDRSDRFTGYPCPPYKIIILDEADSMTQDAQSALRRTMETYSKITRFCLICNYVTRIIEPLASRCAKFRFKALDPVNTIQRIEYIAQQEGVNMEPGVVEALVKTSEGDLRKAITYLQTSAKLFLPSKTGDGDTVMEDGETVGNTVTVRSIEEIAGVVPQRLIDRILEACQMGKGGLYSRVSPVVEDIVAEGWSAGSIINQLHDLIVETETLTPKQKNSILLEMGQTDKMFIDGGDEGLGLLDLCLQIGEILARR